MVFAVSIFTDFKLFYATFARNSQFFRKVLFASHLYTNRFGLFDILCGYFGHFCTVNPDGR